MKETQYCTGRDFDRFARFWSEKQVKALLTMVTNRKEAKHILGFLRKDLSVDSKGMFYFNSLIMVFK